MYENSANDRHSFNTNRNVTYTSTDAACGIHDYSYKPEPVFLTGDQNKDIMLGIELETDKFDGDVNPTRFARFLHQKFSDRVYCKHDGSLDRGVEIVSHPAPLRYHMRKFGWADILGTANECGAHSHDAGTCGLHVHVGRAALGNTDDARDLCIAKLLLVMERFATNEIMAFSRRGHENQYCKHVRTGIEPGDRRDKIIEKSKQTDASFDRYTALNLCNTNTIEFRIFRGTLNPLTFAATLQLVDTMVRYCKTHTLQQVMSCTFGDIVAICKYPELAAYCNRRNIVLIASNEAAA